MTLLAQHWPLLTLLFLVGSGLGAVLSFRIQRNRNRSSLVRWERRLREKQHEHEKELGRFSQTLSAAEKKETNLRNALRESEETVRLLSEKNVPAFESEIRQRNERLAELQRKVSHLRAELADAQDQEATDRREIEKLQAELAIRDSRMDELLTRNAEYSGLREMNTEQEQRYSKLAAQLEAEKQQRQAMDQAYRDRLEQETLALREAQKELEHLRIKAPDYQAELEARDKRIASLSMEFEEMRHRLPTLNDALREREASIEDLLAALSKERKKNKLLLKETAQAEAAPEVSPPPRHAKVISLRPHLSADAVARNLSRNDNAAQRISTVEHELNEWKQRAVPSRRERVSPGLPAAKWQQRTAGKARRDDLKRIRGIGPALENTLNHLGIVCFDQLAQLTEDDIAALGRHDKALPQRLRRGKWIDQARDFSAPDA